MLICNTASKCGFTKQYKGLQSIYEKYKNQGFEILGFPCNDFGEQEPGTNEEIKNFTFHGQPGRLAKTLLSLFEKFPGKKKKESFIDVKLTHQDLADMLGIARESVTKMVSNMKKDGAIDIRDHYVYILDKDKLQSWVQ